MELFILFSKWFWAMGIVISLINAGSFYIRSRQYIREKPELAGGYRKLIGGFLLFFNLPWIVMGTGCVVGGVPSLFYFFRPGDSNPYVIAFQVSVVLLWILGTLWIFIFDGASMLVRHPGLLNIEVQSPGIVKILWSLILVAGISAITAMLLVDFPLIPLQ